MKKYQQDKENNCRFTKCQAIKDKQHAQKMEKYRRDKENGCWSTKSEAIKDKQNAQKGKRYQRDKQHGADMLGIITIRSHTHRHA